MWFLAVPRRKDWMPSDVKQVAVEGGSGGSLKIDGRIC